jgi:hypothetical protein
VTDVTGKVVPRAEVSLLGADGKLHRTERATEAGEIVFTDLPFGDFQVRVSEPGFNSRLLSVTVRNEEESKSPPNWKSAL